MSGPDNGIQEEPTQPSNDAQVSDDELRKTIMKKLQFSHRVGCPADAVVDGFEDLEKCNCSINGMLPDIMEAIHQHTEEAVRAARIDENIKTIAQYDADWEKWEFIKHMNERQSELTNTEGEK